MKDKIAMRCIERLSDVKDRKPYFKLRKVLAKDVKEECLCFFVKGEDCILDSLYVSKGVCNGETIFCKYLRGCSQYILKDNTPVYVVLFCFNEKTYMQLHSKLEYGKYSRFVNSFIYNFLIY